MNVLFLDIGNSTTILYHPLQKKILQTIETPRLFSHPLELNIKKTTKVIVSSVVETIKSKLEKEFPNFYFLNDKDIPFQKISIERPEDIGIDRLLTAWAAWVRYKKNILVIDAGTAITACFITQEGCYEGGLIFPGLGTCSKALNDYTDKIPYIKVDYQSNIIGKSTKEAVQIGLFQGFKHLINGAVLQFKEQFPTLSVVGTGQSLKIFKKELLIDHFHPYLIFEGMASIQDDIRPKLKG